MIEDRKNWLSILAKVKTKDLDECWRKVKNLPDYKLLRAPEIGGAMVQGRLGATGDSFNLGEMTVTRCSVQLETGEIGHGYIQGREKEAAKKVAVLDAIMQGTRRHEVESLVIVPLTRLYHQEKEASSKKAAATKVEFFTMARGESE
ncbi:MAG: phosphonate C-P lyase system protein PhnG [Paracoccaceae bacterium]